MLPLRVFTLIAVWLALSPVDLHAEIRIGTVGPLTGPRAWSGEQFRRGAEMAVADLNTAGGVLGQRLELIVGDDAQDPEQAVAVARKLVADNVVFVAGHRSSDASIAAAPIYADAGILQISPSSTNPRLTQQGWRNVFRVCGRDDQQGVVAGEYLAAQWGKHRIAIVHDGSTYGEGLATQTKLRLNELGMQETLYATYTPDQTDYTAVIDQLRAHQIDVVYVGGYSTDAGLLIRQARDQDVRVQLVSGDALHNSDFWAIAGTAGEGARSTFGVDPRDNPRATDLVERFRAAGYEPEGYTLHTYAAVQVWSQAVAHAGSLDSEQVIHALRNRTFDTVMGPLRFDANGDLIEHPYVWYVWRSGRYVRE